MAKMGHDEVMGRVLDLLADVCGDDAVYGRYCLGALRRYRSLFTRERMIDNCLKLYLDCYGQRKTN